MLIFEKTMVVILFILGIKYSLDYFFGLFKDIFLVYLRNRKLKKLGKRLLDSLGCPYINICVENKETGEKKEYLYIKETSENLQ